MKHTLNGVEEEIKHQHIFKVSTTLLLEQLKKIDTSVDVGDLWAGSFIFKINESFPENIGDYNSHYNKNAELKLNDFTKRSDDKLSNLWNGEVNYNWESLFNQSESVLNEYIEYRRRNTDIYTESLREFASNNWEVKLKFHSKDDVNNDLILSLASIEEYKAFFTKRLTKIERCLIFLQKIKTVLLSIDKRFQFRQIIKFAFKNLDDSHSSVNNSPLQQTTNYLLIKNYNEEKTYNWAY